jgi:hypothetical protein
MSPRSIRELDLLRRGEQLDLADVLEEQLQRVGRDLARRRGRLLLLLVVLADDVDLHLLERAVEVVHRSRIDLQLAQRDRDLVRAQRAGTLRRLQEALGLIGRQQVVETDSL